MKKLCNKLFFLVILFIVSSCNLDNFDFNKLSDDVSLSPEFVMPLARANISIWDIIESVNEENDTLIKKGENDIIKIVYTEEGIYDYQVRDLLDLPQQKSFNSGNKVIGNISIDDVVKDRMITLQEVTDMVDGDIDNIIPLNGTNAIFPETSFVGPPPAYYAVQDIDNFDWIRFAKGDIEITLENMLPVPMSLKGGFIDTQAGSGFAAFNFSNVAASGTATTTVSLNGMSISNKISFRMIEFKTHVTGFPALINLNDYFKLSIKFKNIEISEGSVKPTAQVLDGFTGSFNFDFADNIKVFEAMVKYGTLDVNLNTTSGISGSVKLEFPQIVGESLQDIPFGGSKSMTLAGAKINLASDAVTPYNTVPYKYSISINASTTAIPFNANDAISLNVTLNNLEFQSIKGDFGDKNISIDNGNFNMDMAFFDKIEGDFKLANPQLKLILTNGIGVPAEVNADFVAQNKSGQSVSLNPNPFRLVTPASLGSAAVTQTVEFNKTNSNIVDFVALPPSGNISYSGNIVFNPDGAVTGANANFFDLDAGLKIDLGVDLPFELQIKDLVFSDTVKMDSGDLDMIKRAELIINAVNEIPLDIDVQLFFIDTISGQQYSSSAKNKLLTAAQISDAGVITAVTSSNSIVLQENELEGLKRANGIVFKGSISSPANGTKTAVIYSQSKLNMNVVIKSKFDL